MAALLWFGVDDAGTTVRFPIYGGNTEVRVCVYMWIVSCSLRRAKST